VVERFIEELELRDIVLVVGDGRASEPSHPTSSVSVALTAGEQCGAPASQS